MESQLGSRKLLDHGSVTLLDSMGNDLSIVNAARTSFDQVETEMTERNAGLINFLMRERHGTPFEMCQFKFAVEAPIFVIREWQRHRIGSFNEMSGRYVELERKFYLPDNDEITVQKGKPGNYYYEPMQDQSTVINAIDELDAILNDCFDAYESLLAQGVSKEVARIVLPLSTYTKMVWSVNLRALLNFLSLRNHPHAQFHIRVYADAIENIVSEVVPVTIESFINNGRVTP